MKKKISDLKKNNPTNKTKVTERSKVLENARNFDGRKKITEAFEDGIFQMPEKVLYKNQAEKQAEEKEEKKEADLKKLGDKITKEETKGIDRTFLKIILVINQLLQC